jgi:hypothetical protein
MISDCEILGIEETGDIAAIKRAFRKKVKELHPDVSTGADPLERHASFVEVCDAYKRLLGLRPAGPGVKPTVKYGSNGRGVVPYSDPAYAFYRAGMKYFMMIHPSQWNVDTQRMLNTRIAGNEEDQEIMKKKVLDLVGLFPKAYYYFGLVVHEYPESDWAYDSQEKMSKIEERIGMYKRIIESFSSWNTDKKDAIREYREKHDRQNATLKAVRRDGAKDWQK